MMTAALAFRLPSGLERATRPVLVVVGAKEYKEMQQSALDLTRALPKARGVVVSLGPKSSLAKEHNWALTLSPVSTASALPPPESPPRPARR
jgi:hypothetical protein